MSRSSSWLGGGRGPSCISVRAGAVAGGGTAPAPDVASIEGVRVTATSPDPVGVRCEVLGAGDRPGVADRREPGPPGDRRVQRGRDGVAAPSYRGRTPEEDR